jgi:cytochrome b6-f complex iron-sulfur subunit
MTAGNSITDTVSPSQTGPTPEPDPAGAMSRRKVFAVGSAGCLALGLAACGGGSSTGVADAGDSGDSATTDSATPAAGDTSAASSGGGTTLTALSKVPVGGAIGLKVGDKPIIVAQPTSGKVVAFSAICPHAGCTVGASSSQLKCPCHGSTFDLATGKNLSGPAPKPLTALNVAVDGDNVVLNA